MTAASSTEPDRGSGGVGIGQPGVQRPHRHLDRKSEEHRPEHQPSEPPGEHLGGVGGDVDQFGDVERPLPARPERK